LKYIFKKHVKSDADRNQKDEDGDSLYHYLVNSYNTGEGNALIALNLLGNHGIDVCTQSNYSKHVENVEPPRPHELPKATRQETEGKVPAVLGNKGQHLANHITTETLSNVQLWGSSLSNETHGVFKVILSRFRALGQLISV
jgi:hypothetical protein